MGFSYKQRFIDGIIYSVPQQLDVNPNILEMLIQGTETPFISNISLDPLCLLFIRGKLPLFTIFVIRIIIVISDAAIITALAHEKIAMLLVYRIVGKMRALLVQVSETEGLGRKPY
jgi:hypothetical protein